VDKEKKRLAPFLSAITHLKGHGLCNAGVIGAYHSRRVAPLMARALPLFVMTAEVQLEGTVLAQGTLRNLEIQQHIWEALEETDATFPVEGHPPMRPDTGFIDLESISQPPHQVLLPSLTLTFNFTGWRM
jgi:hypothetical protein